jgi:hypothetical protein
MISLFLIPAVFPLLFGKLNGRSKEGWLLLEPLQTLQNVSWILIGRPPLHYTALIQRAIHSGTNSSAAASKTLS